MVIYLSLFIYIYIYVIYIYIYIYSEVGRIRLETSMRAFVSQTEFTVFLGLFLGVGFDTCLCTFRLPFLIPHILNYAHV